MAYEEIFNYGNLIIYKNARGDIRYNCQGAPWTTGLTANSPVVFKSNAGITALTENSQLLIPIRITGANFAIIGTGYFLIKPTVVTLIPLVTASGTVNMYGCNYGI